MWPAQRLVKHREPRSSGATYVNLSQAGVQPFMRNPGPSRARPSLTTCITCDEAVRSSTGCVGAGFLLRLNPWRRSGSCSSGRRPGHRPSWPPSRRRARRARGFGCRLGAACARGWRALPRRIWLGVSVCGHGYNKKGLPYGAICETSFHGVSTRHFRELSRVRGLTHEHASHNVRGQAPPKDPDAFLLADTVQSCHGVRVAEALGARLGGVGAHAHEDDLCRIPNHTCQPARNTGTRNGCCGGELGGARALLQLLRQRGVQAEAGGRVCRLPEDGGGEA